MSLSTQIFAALVLGLATGIFFGERIAPVQIVGDGFIRLLQMTVLPYVSVSLISGLGSLRAEGAAALALRAGTILLVLWSLAIAVVLTVPLAFPDWESASFFSTNLVEQGVGFDFLALFIPSNPFQSLADSTVPSVVVFSAALGIALINVERKQGLLRGLDSVKAALSSIATFVVRLAPVGVFAIAANAAGTLSLDQAASLQVYMAVYAGVALVLALWALPGLVMALSDYTWMEIIGRFRGTLLTAFATGNLFVVLSVLTESIKTLVRERGEDPDRAEHFVEVVVPVAFTFPSVGKLLSLAFVLFAGWVSGYSLSVSQYPSLVLAGISSYFGATVVAIPFLLDLYQIPTDTFQLFLVADNVVGLRFSTMVGAVHLIAIALLASVAMEGRLQLRPIRLLRYLTVTVVLLLSVVLGIRFTFEALGHEYEGYNRFIGMQPIRYDDWPKVLESLPPAEEITAANRSAVDRINARGTLRVAYLPDRLPWAFRNEDGRLVGFDVEMAHVLARELGVGLEFVQVGIDALPGALDSGSVDVAMSGVAVDVASLSLVSFSKSYVDETIAFVVSDHLRDEYSSRQAVKRLVDPVIAIPDHEYYYAKLEHYLPNAKVVPVRSPRDFFRAKAGAFDALLYTAESGSAWSLIYPQYTVAVPHPDILKVPLAYAVKRGDDEMVLMLSAWIELKRRDRTIADLYQHWILGQTSDTETPRWSILDNLILAVPSDEAAAEVAPARVAEPEAVEGVPPPELTEPGDTASDGVEDAEAAAVD